MAPAASRIVGHALRLTTSTPRCGDLRARPATLSALGGKGTGGTWNWQHCKKIAGLSSRGKGHVTWLRPEETGSRGLPQRARYRVNACKGQQLHRLSTLPSKEVEKKPFLHENIYTIPNALTATRLLCAPAIGYLLLHNHHTWALGLFVYAGVTDLVDGWVARRWNMQTVVGTVLDPMADKALMTVVVGVLGYQGLLPLPLAVLILGRDVLLSLTAFYYRWVSLPAPRTLARYWDFSLPSAEVKPTTVSKVNTFLQLGLIGATMGGLAFPGVMGETAQSALEVMWWVVGGTTVWSGASYLGSGGVRILGKKV